MQRLSWGVVISLLFLLFWLTPLVIKAGGGPVEVRLRAVQGYVNQSVKFDVYFHPTKPDEIPAQTMYLYLQDPKDGRSCKLDSNRTDSTGKVSGECTSSVVGDVKFYIHWMEGGRSSEDQTISFVKAPPPQVSPPTTVKKISLPSPLPTPAAPSPSPNLIKLTPQPSPTLKPSPPPEPTAAKSLVATDQNKWLLLISLSFAGGLGLPIIFYLITKK